MIDNTSQQARALDTMPEAIICIGIPGSGKSTWARQQEGYTVIELDEARKLINGAKNCQDNIDHVVAVRDNWLSKALDNKENIIISDTNLNSKHRVLLEKKLAKFGYQVKLRIFDVDLEECLRRNDARADTERVPDHAMNRMIQQFEDHMHEMMYPANHY